MHQNSSLATGIANLLWFSPTVPVRTTRVGMTREVSSVEAAAEELLTWEKRGAPWRRAVQACIDAGEGRTTAGEARKAFLAAAKACGMLRGNR
ncbi:MULTISPECIES: DUF982 domain-containing protein [unclassified Mesorhizobium]|uniref:DUF982 domain-containing protein n=1 Tax=unclassified Mesorhizobium TaxID=325217 RepID=UPI000FCADE15|nr:MULTISPECIES: DUF982 domain-containing protein [unclassified Mesorhizobium]RUX93796.1 DUF982 domain-containing protein [Mesorhizobium sp. M7D.F.Ca.US.004.01.2.1]RVA34875.1 DUF982 domain-containing protein [Mesorhizobium sp. M7D.F.Ca.US.004.03.1.1]